MSLYNVYCDESSHLENDGKKAMALGAIWCPHSVRVDMFIRIREIKKKHNLSELLEIKWNKVSIGKIKFYEELIDFFFDSEDIHFRCLVVPDKNELNHHLFEDQTHDKFYYKMYFNLLKIIFDPKNSYNIYIDKKDSNSKHKIEELKQILRNNHYDYSKNIIKKIQEIRAREIELVQLADLFTGAIAYVQNGFNSSEAKLKIIERIRVRSKYSLLKSTLPRESKFNLFVWQPHKKN